MSETTPAPQGAADPVDPAATGPAATDHGAPAPAETGAATEPNAETPDEAGDKPQEKPSRGDKRFAVLSARLARTEAELAEARRHAAPRPPEASVDPAVQRLAEQHAEKLYQERVVAERVKSFHDAGKAAFADWQDRCQSLMEMGADPAFAELLVDLPDGAKVAAALADDPESLEQIAAIKTERGRAIALGKYSAGLAANPATPARSVSRAPAPIRPVTGTARVAFNEATASPQQLVEYYAKQAMAKRGL